MTTLAFLPNLGWPEMLVIGVVMLLLFGRRLPEVGRSLGQGVVQFKKGLKDVDDEVRGTGSSPQSQSASSPQFESAKPPHNPDLAGSAHTSSTQSQPVASEQSQPKTDS